MAQFCPVCGKKIGLLGKIVVNKLDNGSEICVNCSFKLNKYLKLYYKDVNCYSIEQLRVILNQCGKLEPFITQWNKIDDKYNVWIKTKKERLEKFEEKSRNTEKEIDENRKLLIRDLKEDILEERLSERENKANNGYYGIDVSKLASYINEMIASNSIHYIEDFKQFINYEQQKRWISSKYVEDQVRESIELINDNINIYMKAEASFKLIQKEHQSRIDSYVDSIDTLKIYRSMDLFQFCKLSVPSEIDMFGFEGKQSELLSQTVKEIVNHHIQYFCKDNSKTNVNFANITANSIILANYCKVFIEKIPGDFIFSLELIGGITETKYSIKYWTDELKENKDNITAQECLEKQLSRREEIEKELNRVGEDLKSSYESIQPQVTALETVLFSKNIPSIENKKENEDNNDIVQKAKNDTDTQVIKDSTGQNTKEKPLPLTNPANQYSADSKAICPKCGGENRPTAKFCNRCGNALIKQSSVQEVVYCDNCGNKIRPGKHFCSVCGNKID